MGSQIIMVLIGTLLTITGFLSSFILYHIWKKLDDFSVKIATHDTEIMLIRQAMESLPCKEGKCVTNFYHGG
jgi:hypothetical protein